MNCTVCGNEIKKGEHFCSRCGVPFYNDEYEFEIPKEDNANDTVNDTKKVHKRNPRVTVAWGCAFGIILIAVATLFVLKIT